MNFVFLSIKYVYLYLLIRERDREKRGRESRIVGVLERVSKVYHWIKQRIAYVELVMQHARKHWCKSCDRIVSR